MKKLTIKSLIKFRGKSDPSKKTFIKNLKAEKEKSASDGGGDYWISALSAISNSYRHNDVSYLDEKIDELKEKLSTEKRTTTKGMYQKNIDLLSNFNRANLKKWRLGKEMKFLHKNREDFIINIKGLQVEAKPHHVFSVEKDGRKEVGGIWFIAQLKAFKKDELGMFTEMLQHYLKVHFSKGVTLSPQYCVAVDVINNIEVNFSQMGKGGLPLLLNSTLEEIKTLL